MISLKKMQNINKKIQGKTSQLILGFKPIRLLIKNRRAVNAVISNIILIGAVLVVGFATLYWSQGQSTSYQQEYGSLVNSNIDQVREKVVFEYVGVKNGNLTVYLLNSGTIGDVKIANVFVNGVPKGAGISLRSLSNGSIINSLSVGSEGYFEISTTGVSSPYLVKIITVRGSTFASIS